MVIVWGSIDSKPENTEEVLRLSLEHVHRSRAEPGCIKHDVHLDVENRNRVVFFEQWEDLPALHTHFSVPASGDFVTQVAGLAMCPPEIEIFESRLASVG